MSLIQHLELEWKVVLLFSGAIISSIILYWCRSLFFGIAPARSVHSADAMLAVIPIAAARAMNWRLESPSDCIRVFNFVVVILVLPL